MVAERKGSTDPGGCPGFSFGANQSTNRKGKTMVTATHSKPAPVQVWGEWETVAPEVGGVVWIDGRAVSDRLEAEPAWDRADFRIKTHSGGPIQSLAANVQITGRKAQRRAGSHWVRCKIVWVGDGEADVAVGGWLLVTDSP